MAYNTKDLYKQAIEILENNSDIMFIEHLVSLMPCVKSTFYDHIIEGSNESNSIKEIIEKSLEPLKIFLEEAISWTKLQCPWKN